LLAVIHPCPLISGGNHYCVWLACICVRGLNGGAGFLQSYCNSPGSVRKYHILKPGIPFAQLSGLWRRHVKHWHILQHLDADHRGFLRGPFRCVSEIGVRVDITLPARLYEGDLRGMFPCVIAIAAHDLERRYRLASLVLSCAEDSRMPSGCGEIIATFCEKGRAVSPPTGVSLWQAIDHSCGHMDFWTGTDRRMLVNRR